VSDQDDQGAQLGAGRPGELAPSLEQATVRSLVYVDRRGQVRSPEEYRTANTLYYGAVGALVVGLDALLWVAYGTTGLGAAGLLTVLFGRQLLATRRLQRAVSLMVAGRLDEAEAMLARVRRAFLIPTHFKARADQGLARVSMLRGRYEEALARQESALGLLEGRRSSATRRTVEYARMVTLVNLGRTEEARRRLEALPRVLEGDYLRFVRATTELYIAFGEGRHELPAAYLREQADIALGIPTGRALLGLLAWAEAQAGRRAASARLLGAAREREGGELVRSAYPLLAAWLDAQAAPPEAPSEPPGDS
jgi:tetratricopeptide (TPR) repeat protein